MIFNAFDLPSANKTLRQIHEEAMKLPLPRPILPDSYKVMIENKNDAAPDDCVWVGPKLEGK